MNALKILKEGLPRPLKWFLSVGLVAFLLVGAFFLAQPVKAAPGEVCTTNADGDWSEAIWTCDGASSAPDNTTDVVILHEVTISTNQEVMGLTVQVDDPNNLYGMLTFTAPVTLTLHGDFSVDEFGVFDPGNNFFEPNTPSTGGTVVFAGANQTITTHGMVVDFFDLSKVAVTGGESLLVDPQVADSGGIHVFNSLLLTGVDGTQLLNLGSTIPGSRWGLESEWTTNVNFVDVQDSNNYGLTPITVLVGNDGLNNVGWIFNALSVSLSTSASPINSAGTVTFTAMVTPADATGTVNFRDNGTTIPGCGTKALTAGSATCPTNSLVSQGVHIITAVFNGNGGYDGDTVTSNEVNQVVQGLSVVTLSASVSPSNFGQPVVFIAQLAPASATGEVKFSLDGVTIVACEHQPVTQVAGVPTATCTVSDLTLGSHSVTAEYSGNTEINASTSLAHTQVVKYASTIGLISSLNPSVVGQPVTLTVTMGSSSATPPSGNVSFKNGGVNIAGCENVALVAGTATCVINLPVGSYTITAAYAGDSETFASTSGNLPQVVGMAKYYFPTVGK